MARRDDIHSVGHEPHLNTDQGQIDPTEERAARLLSSEAATSRNSRPGQSIYDEPDILPHRAGELIGQDWSCAHCGYNLRGRPLESACPECGQRTLYRPPPKNADSYEAWLLSHQATTTSLQAWGVALAVPIIGGIFAIGAALFGTSPGGIAAMSMPLLLVVFGPVIEEVMKIAATSYIIEVRPYLFTKGSQVLVATTGSAFVFAAVENAIYISFSGPNPPTEFLIWRWTVCVAMHVCCTWIATRGLTDVWEKTMTEHRPPALAGAVGSLIIAIAVHGAYNAAVLGWSRL